MYRVVALRNETQFVKVVWDILSGIKSLLFRLIEATYLRHLVSKKNLDAHLYYPVFSTVDMCRNLSSTRGAIRLQVARSICKLPLRGSLILEKMMCNRKLTRDRPKVLF